MKKLFVLLMPYFPMAMIVIAYALIISGAWK
jgi:hypothetical protein